MSRVLLLNPPSPFLLDQAVFPPLSLLYLAASLEEWGHEVKVVDLGLDDNWDHFDPHVIGITGLTPHIPFLKEYVPALKRLHPDAKIIVGGPHFTNAPQDARRLGADEVCVGDGEPAVLRSVMAPHLPVRRGVVNIDEWPRPARHLIDLHRYHYMVGGERGTPILTSRGCPFACRYCSKGMGTRPARYLALDRVEEELSELRVKGFGGLQVYDDEVNISTKRLVAVARLFNVYGFKWRAFVRSNLFTRRQAEAMADNGCVEVCCGVESGSDEILQAVDKKATVADATRMVQVAREVGLRVKAFLILGLPGESEETAAATREWLLRVRPDDFDIAVFTPYPGSHIHAHPTWYDINIEGSYWDVPYFHKGTPGQYKVVVSTSALSALRIQELRDEIEFQVRNELGLKQLGGE